MAGSVLQHDLEQKPNEGDYWLVETPPGSLSSQLASPFTQRSSPSRHSEYFLEECHVLVPVLLAAAAAGTNMADL